MLNHSATLYLSAVFIWGTSWFAIKFQLGTVAEEVSLVYRFFLASVTLMIFCLATRRTLRFSPSQHGFMALQGLFLFSSNYLIFYWATHLLTSGLVAVAFSTVIFMNIIGSALAFRQGISSRVVLGAILGLGGIVMIFWPEVRTFELDGDGARGLAMSLFATALASVGNIISARNQKHDLPVIQTNAWGMGYGSLVMAAYAIFHGASFNFDPSLAYAGSLLYLSLFASIFAFGSYLTLIGRIGADKAAYAAVVFPIVALAISTVFENYQWTPIAAAGLGLVLLGNVVVLRNPAPTVRAVQTADN
jgi:drug/metabolite transporter (DMT)-like permease